MKGPIEVIKGRIVETSPDGVLTIKARFDDWYTLTKRGYKDVEITLIDSRPLSDKQRKACYALLHDINEWSGQDDLHEVKYLFKLRFWVDELNQTADTLFSLSNAPMSVVAAFQRYLVRFIVKNNVPTKRPLLDNVEQEDIGDYIYSCLIQRRCCVCGKLADLHHSDAVGMGRDRTEIVHEGMVALPLCRLHHGEAHQLGQTAFEEKYHLAHGVALDKTLCRLYQLKEKK